MLLFNVSPFFPLLVSVLNSLDNTLRTSVKRDILLEEREEERKETNAGQHEKERGEIVKTEYSCCEPTILEEERQDTSLSEECTSLVNEMPEVNLSNQNFVINYEELIMSCCRQTEPCSFSDILPGDE